MTSDDLLNRWQVGISLVLLGEADLDSDAAMHAWLSRSLPLDGSWTLQAYVKHPLLYRGRKFDMRVWAVITSVDPLRLYMLDRAFPKISTVPYSTDTDIVGRHCLSSPKCACSQVKSTLVV